MPSHSLCIWVYKTSACIHTFRFDEEPRICPGQSAVVQGGCNISVPSFREKSYIYKHDVPFWSVIFDVKLILT